MSHTESSTVTKSNVNPGRGFLRDIPCQNTYREGMPRGTRDTNSGSDTEAENTAKEKNFRAPIWNFCHKYSQRETLKKTKA